MHILELHRACKTCRHCMLLAYHVTCKIYIGAVSSEQVLVHCAECMTVALLMRKCEGVSHLCPVQVVQAVSLCAHHMFMPCFFISTLCKTVLHACMPFNEPIDITVSYMHLARRLCKAARRRIEPRGALQLLQKGAGDKALICIAPLT